MRFTIANKLIVFLIILVLVASISALAKPNKTPFFSSNNDLITQSNTQQDISVIIVLKFQPLSSTASEIKSGYRVSLEKYRERIDKLMGRRQPIVPRGYNEMISQEQQEHELREIGADSAYRGFMSRLSTEKLNNLRENQQKLDDLQDQIKTHIFERQEALVKSDQSQISSIVEDCGGIVVGDSGVDSLRVVGPESVLARSKGTGGR